MYVNNKADGTLNLQSRKNGSNIKTVFSVNNGTGVLNFGVQPTIQDNKVWHAGNDGSGSGLDADKLRGAEPSTNSTNSTIAQRNSSGDILCRLVRPGIKPNHHRRCYSVQN